MTTLKINSPSPEATRKIGQLLGELAQPGEIFLLSGDLGVGKTCLTQGIAWGLGSQEYALSPTFVLMRELHGRLPLYHIDLYRLDQIQEISDLGLDDYLFGQGICVIEWAEKGISVLPKDNLLIKIKYTGDNQRNLEFHSQGLGYSRLLKGLQERCRQEGLCN
jgi:tRNA threonylcarbamoyladenosine biosynthesis protein TsaE